jgi:hypothetical protein
VPRRPAGLRRRLHDRSAAGLACGSQDGQPTIRGCDIPADFLSIH